jgi:hypothetical protein
LAAQAHFSATHAAIQFVNKPPAGSVALTAKICADSIFVKAGFDELKINSVTLNHSAFQHPMVTLIFSRSSSGAAGGPYFYAIRMARSKATEHIRGGQWHRWAAVLLPSGAGSGTPGNSR